MIGAGALHALAVRVAPGDDAATDAAAHHARPGLAARGAASVLADLPNQVIGIVHREIARALYVVPLRRTCTCQSGPVGSTPTKLVT